jgi:membrane-associated phospholipid phosphatase
VSVWRVHDETDTSLTSKNQNSIQMKLSFIFKPTRFEKNFRYNSLIFSIKPYRFFRKPFLSSFKVFLSIILLFVVSACDKTIVEPTLSVYVPNSFNQNAGQWKTYILTNSSEIAIETPKATNSNEYKAELAKLKTTVSNLTEANRETIRFWGAGAVYRWNEIARELSARYNLAPASNAQGIYPVPDPANPLADPRYPFANPPYTARALAYLSVAQYDALVSAWGYKYKYNRPSAGKTDNTIPTALPLTELPSYPSEDAVVAGASYTVLAAMFPGEIPYLQSKLEESKGVRMMAGLNVESDVVAGETLGKAVANKVMGRAKNDGMSASNNQTLTAGMKEGAIKLGIKEPWVSQEAPARPPMLPNYGSVQTWNFDRATMLEIRPKMPYIVGSDDWKKEFAELETIQKTQTREQARIANYWSDGAGSYTPPGHWHRTAANLCASNLLSEVATARTLALLGTALMDAGVACWDTKYYYYTPRPQQFGIKTSVGVPNFPAYTSGHSTFSAAAATVLGYIFPREVEKLNAQAKEASESRIYGLIHYRSDCEMGLTHGKKIGDYAITRAKADRSGL